MTRPLPTTRLSFTAIVGSVDSPESFTVYSRLAPPATTVVHCLAAADHPPIVAGQMVRLSGWLEPRGDNVPPVLRVESLKILSDLSMRPERHYGQTGRLPRVAID